MTPRQFSRLLKHSSYRAAFEGELLVQEGKPVQSLVYIVRGNGDITIGDRRIGSLQSHTFATSLSCLLPHTKPAPAPTPAQTDQPHAATAERPTDLGKHFQPMEYVSYPLIVPLPPNAACSAAELRQLFQATATKAIEALGTVDLQPTAEQLQAEGIASPRRSKKKRPSTHKTARDKYRSTASTRLTSPEGRLLVIPLHAVRQLLESDPGLEKPLLSLAAAETASRLNLTQRRVQRLQRYKQRLHAATTGVYRVPPERHADLLEYAERHGISAEEHEDALRSVGWTPQEWDEGYSGTAFRAITAKQLQHASGFVSNALQAAAALFVSPASPTGLEDEDDDDDDDDDDEDDEDDDEDAGSTAVEGGAVSEHKLSSEAAAKELHGGIHAEQQGGSTAVTEEAASSSAVKLTPPAGAPEQMPAPVTDNER